MNCCDAAGNCTQGQDCPIRRPSCDQLAVCQDRTPPCKNCHPVSEGTKSAQAIWIGLKERALVAYPEFKNLLRGK